MYNFKIKDEPFAIGYLSTDSESKYIRTGLGYIEAAKAVNIGFDPDTFFPILDFGNMACTSSWSSGQSPNLWLLGEKANNAPENRDDYLYIIEQMKDLDVGSHWSEFSENEWDITKSGAGWGGTWGGHAVPDLYKFASLGTDKMRKKVSLYKEKNPEKSDFYEGLLYTLDAVDILFKKIRTAAKKEYEKSGEKKLEKIINALGHCPKEPA